MEGFKEEAKRILAFWSEHMVDHKYGGFYGQIDGRNQLHPDANKGAVLNCRILWTFSAAYRTFGSPTYLQVAERAFHYIMNYFIDKTHGGLYWELDSKGDVINAKKQIYAQGFAIYGLTEFYLATSNAKALELAINLFHLLEKHKDTHHGGYFEAFTQDWKPLADMRLSAKDANEKKSMNTHLHILEPYTNLYRVWKDKRLKGALRELIIIFREKIVDPASYHLNLFFNEAWGVKSTDISYGHDIESAWLLLKATAELNEPALKGQIHMLAVNIARAATDGIQQDGSMIYEKKPDGIDMDRHWWVQAEAVVGFMYSYELTDDKMYLNLASNLWAYIQSYLVDNVAGEWFWSVDDNGRPNRIDDKAGFWKCPYHNGRMCFEMISHFSFE
ncbi:AGE family epimerase/isomerase [Olivibacter domesticus]|uniref:Cellobiose 2-epimerase n=1 Tax=Olivibacter domesticus TaxID=407022 RepID=A0A1H7JMI7_OLID1|nr:AGE family epimerase/isomerase [Olivibacter domesticus]SEK74685.1 mannobiose 2-epimerase [Olivibacter domesticus]